MTLGRPDLRKRQERDPGHSWTSSHVRALLEWGIRLWGRKGTFLKHLLCARGIHQWFSNLTVHQNPLEGLLISGLLALPPEFLIQ